MSNIAQALSNINLLEELAGKKTTIHRLHPLVKLLTTLAFLLVTVSFGKYELSRLFPLILFPMLVLVLGEIPAMPILKRMVLALPFIAGIGIFNPLLDQRLFYLSPTWSISAGWISFAALLLKGALTVAAALLLIATTGMGRIAQALRMLGLPKIFVSQLLLTYRYISVLVEEVARILRAYALRSPFEKGIRFSIWGSLAGHLLLKSFDRAERVFQAMRCRGFAGEFPLGPLGKIKGRDVLFLSSWLICFMIMRVYNIPMLIESVVTGAVK